jgi:hypothetical protein
MPGQDGVDQHRPVGTPFSIAAPAFPTEDCRKQVFAPGGPTRRLQLTRTDLLVNGAMVPGVDGALSWFEPTHLRHWSLGGKVTAVFAANILVKRYCWERRVFVGNGHFSRACAELVEVLNGPNLACLSPSAR